MRIRYFYVWFDAPIGYLSATQEWAVETAGVDDQAWKDWWYAPEAVRYTQFMAKDNLPFHTIMWPATILGAQDPWKMANYIKGFNWLNYYGGKFSTSAKRGVFLDQALEILPADYWRYALMASAPESSDSAFTWEQFQIKVNKELADNLGNFVNRILKFAASRFDATIPKGGTPGEAEARLQESCQASINTLHSALNNLEFRKATEALCGLWTLGNQYIDERAPWVLFKQNREEAALVIRTSINLIRIYAIAASPFIPFTCQILFDALNLSEAERTSRLRAAVDFTILHAGRSFETPPPLFQKLDNDYIEELKVRFGGGE